MSENSEFFGTEKSVMLTDHDKCKLLLILCNHRDDSHAYYLGQKLAATVSKGWQRCFPSKDTGNSSITTTPNGEKTMLVPMSSEREQLDVMTDTELVAYWNILQTPGIKADDGKTERHKPIVSELLTERNIPHEKGKRTEQKEITDHSLEFLIYDEQSPRP